MLQARLIVLSALSIAALAASACTPPVDCTTEARASVQVTLVDSAGVDIGEADVSYSVDGGGTFTDCEEVIANQWVCGWEVSGEIVVRAEAIGYVTAEQTVTVGADECHVIGQTVELTLEDAVVAGQWEEPRSYFIQLIEDDDECANSWELYGMNCYQMAWFCPSGDAEMIVTDIINSGEYAIEDNEVFVEFPQPGDVASEWAFRIQDDDSLVDQYGATWQRDVDFDIIGAPYCDGGDPDDPMPLY